MCVRCVNVVSVRALLFVRASALRVEPLVAAYHRARRTAFHSISSRPKARRDATYLSVAQSAPLSPQLLVLRDTRIAFAAPQPTPCPCLVRSPATVSALPPAEVKEGGVAGAWSMATEHVAAWRDAAATHTETAVGARMLRSCGRRRPSFG